MGEHWFPCPNCGDDNTYKREVSPSRPCGVCRKHHAVVAVDGGKDLNIIAARPGRRTRRFWRRKRVPGRTRGGRRKQRRNTERLINGKAVKWSKKK